MDLLEMKKVVEKTRKWALVSNNTKNGVDAKMLFKAITGNEPIGELWNTRYGNKDYSKAMYAYSVYSFRGLNNWEEYKKRPNADKAFLAMLLLND